MSNYIQKMVVGARVNIYHDPFTRVNHEGGAVVCEVLLGPCPDGYFHIMVKFPDEPGTTWRRMATEADVVPYRNGELVG